MLFLHCQKVANICICIISAMFLYVSQLCLSLQYALTLMQFFSPRISRHMRSFLKGTLHTKVFMFQITFELSPSLAQRKKVIPLHARKSVCDNGPKSDIDNPTQSQMWTQKHTMAKIDLYPKWGERTLICVSFT